VELTAQGKDLLARATPVFDDELERLLRAPLASSSLAQLATGLRTLRHSIGDRTEVTA
jgi:hypothetical protein